MAVATLHVAGSLVTIAWSWDRAMGVPFAVPRVLSIVSFLLCAVLLLVGGRLDHRARLMGAVFLVTATSFWTSFTGVGWILPEAFLPALMWAFAREFPRAARRTRLDDLARLAVPLSAAMGAGLWIANLPPVLEWLPHLGRRHVVYWATISLLALPALAAIAWRARDAVGSESKRAKLLIAGILIGIAPIPLDVVIETLWPAARRFGDDHRGGPRGRGVRVPSLDAVLGHLGGACRARARRAYGPARIVPAPAHAAPACGGDSRADGRPRMDVLQPARSHGRSRHCHGAGPVERRGLLRGSVGGGLSSTPARVAGCLGIPGDRGPRAAPGCSRIGADAGCLCPASGRRGGRDRTPCLRCTGDDDGPRRNRRRVHRPRDGLHCRRGAPAPHLGRRVHAGVGPTANPRRPARPDVRLSSAAGLRRRLGSRHGRGSRGSGPGSGNRARRRPGRRPALG